MPVDGLILHAFRLDLHLLEVPEVVVGSKYGIRPKQLDDNVNMPEPGANDRQDSVFQSVFFNQLA